MTLMFLPTKILHEVLGMTELQQQSLVSKAWLINTPKIYLVKEFFHKMNHLKTFPDFLMLNVFWIFLLEGILNGEWICFWLY